MKPEDRILTVGTMFNGQASAYLVHGYCVKRYITIQATSLIETDISGRWVKGRRYQAYHPKTGAQVFYEFQK